MKKFEEYENTCFNCEHFARYYARSGVLLVKVFAGHCRKGVYKGILHDRNKVKRDEECEHWKKKADKLLDDKVSLLQTLYSTLHLMTKTLQFVQEDMVYLSEKQKEWDKKEEK